MTSSQDGNLRAGAQGGLRFAGFVQAQISPCCFKTGTTAANSIVRQSIPTRPAISKISAFRLRSFRCPCSAATLMACMKRLRSMKMRVVSAVLAMAMCVSSWRCSGCAVHPLCDTLNRSIREYNQLKYTIFPVYFQYFEDSRSAMEGLSERGYSAHSGLSRGAVQKARKTGRLVLFGDRSINAAALPQCGHLRRGGDRLRRSDGCCDCQGSLAPRARRQKRDIQSRRSERSPRWSHRL